MYNNNNYMYDKNINKYKIYNSFMKTRRIIINDDCCSKSFFTKVTTNLEKKGFNFIAIRKCNYDFLDNDIVVTIDQQYNSSPYVSFFCPFHNECNDNSDALSISMYASFKHNKIESNGVFSGQKGYRKNKNGIINSRIPTSTEDILHNYGNINFVTISFGANTYSIDLIANSIIEGIARFLIYSLNTIDNDLIYRVETNENLDFVANKFNVPKNSIKILNNINNNLTQDITIINPSILNCSILNDKISIELLN